MPEQNAPDFGTVSQWITLVAILAGGLLTAMVKMFRSVKKPPDVYQTVEGNLELVRLAKANADLEMALKESDLRHEFWTEIRRNRDEMDGIVAATRKTLYEKLDEVTVEMGEMKAAIARIEGLLGGRQPRR